MKHLWLFLKGLAMGAADVVPGVSGGTIAFITGIYTELLDSIKSINLNALNILFRQGPAAAWQAINGTFLLVLGSGILIALLSLARVIHYLLMHYPVWVWSFFFGLILASCCRTVGRNKGWKPVSGICPQQQNTPGTLRLSRPTCCGNRPEIATALCASQ